MSSNMEATLKTMNEIVQQNLERLLDVWNELGHDESVISERLKSVIKHTGDFLYELVDETENEKVKILDDIDAALKKIQNLRLRLRIKGVMEGYLDTPLVLLITQLQDLIKQYENEIQSKMQNINKLLQDEVILCRKLGTTPKKLVTKPVLPTPEEITDFEKYVERMNQQVFELEEQFLQIKCDIMQMLDDLGQRPTTDFEREILLSDESTFILSTENMTRLKEWQNTLKHGVQERRGEINELRQKLLSLWELLEEETEYRTRFTSEIEGIGEDTLRKLKDEIIRCNEKKKAHIKEYIDKHRKEIVKWWEICKYGIKQRSDFIVLFKSECYTDDLLMLHELQLEKLKLYYENNKKIFDLIDKRAELMKRYMYLAEECGDNKDRFKNRGGKLLREEKERKEVNIKLPKIENELLCELQKYKDLNQADFLIEDKSVEQMINEEANRFREKKTATLSAKKKQRDITMTPNQNGRSILTHTNLTASKRKAQPLRSINNNPSSAPPKRSKVVEEQQLSEPSASRAKTAVKQPPRSASRTGAVPKIKVNNQTVGKASYCVRRRLCPTKRLSKDRRESSNSRRTRRGVQQSQASVESSDEYYNQFMVGISSRSSAVPQQKENQPDSRKTPQKTPGRSPRTPRTVTRTPRTPRTPDTPRTAVRLKVASPLPFLF